MFEIYPLWKSGMKSILDYPYLYRPIVDKRGADFDIEYPLHGYYFERAVECVSKQVGKFLDSTVSIKELIKYIDCHNKTYLVYESDSFRLPLMELELYLAKYSNDTKLLEGVIKNINKKSKKWNPKHFDEPIEVWKKELFDRMDHWDEELSCIQVNLNSPKIKRLNKGHLII